MKHIKKIAAAALTLSALFGGAALAQQSETEKTYGAWKLVCKSETSADCFAYSGGRFGSEMREFVLMSVRAGNEKNLSVEVSIPYGDKFAENPKTIPILLNGRPAESVQITSCSEAYGMCSGTVKIDEAQAEKLLAAREIAITLESSKHDRIVSVIPPQGLRAAVAAMNAPK